MKLAWVLLTADDLETGPPQIQFENMDMGHFVNAAWQLERYADNPTLWKTIPGGGEFHGKPYGETLQVATIEFFNDEFNLEIHAKKVKPFVARSAAFFLRNRAMMPELIQAAVQGFIGAMNAQAQAQANAAMLDKIQLPAGVAMPRG